MDNLVITIARGFGSGGKLIGSKVAADLGIHCYENRILTLASEMSGVDETTLEQFNERLSNSGGLFRRLLKGEPHKTKRTENGVVGVEGEFVSDDQVFAVQKRVIENLADTESCVIIGKCADWILKDRTNVISVYIEAPRAYCREEIMNRFKVSPAVADRSIEQTDKYRADYYRYYTGGNYWTNPVNYDLTLNSARIGFDKCVETIEQFIQIKYPGFVVTPTKNVVQ